MFSFVGVMDNHSPSRAAFYAAVARTSQDAFSSASPDVDGMPFVMSGTPSGIWVALRSQLKGLLHLKSTRANQRCFVCTVEGDCALPVQYSLKQAAHCDRAAYHMAYGAHAAPMQPLPGWQVAAPFLYT
jgi:hypothetical protein